MPTLRGNLYAQLEKADVLVFDYPTTTALWEACCTDARIVYLDMGAGRMTPEIARLFAQRATILPVVHGDDHRMTFDEAALRDAVLADTGAADPSAFRRLLRGRRLMCGLAAFFEPGVASPMRCSPAPTATCCIAGRIPAGHAAEPGWALVFRRLAIMDPGSASDQPMTDETGRCTLIFNGEIYNFRKLRAELEAAGVRFRTSGDTETILQGYLHWGEAVLDRLEGMYAFVLIDRKRNVALAARDPFGIKPLYLCQRGNRIGIASEMRPLYRLVEPQPDETALAELLAFTWAAGNLSNVRGIERVPGGTLLTISLQDGSCPAAASAMCSIR